MNVVVAEHARALSARGHDVHVVTRANTELDPGEYTLAPLDPGDTARPGARSGAEPGAEPGAAPGADSGAGPRLHAIAAGAPDLRKSALASTLPTFSRGLAGLGPFDAVHAHYWLSGIAALPVAAAHRTTLAFSFHTVAAEKNARLAAGDRAEPDLRLAAERALTRNARIIAGSASELASITSHYGAPRHTIDVIHPGVDTELFRPRRPACSARSATSIASETSVGRSLRVTVLGRVQPLKGQELAVGALGEIAQQDAALAARIELVIAGEPTPGAETYAAGLRTLAERLGVIQRVRFLPAQHRAATAELLATSDVVIIPSHSETFGLVALEAAACGVPTVVGAHTGLLEAAPEHVAALHVHGRDPAAWAQAITTLLTDTALRESLGNRAREFALRHSWDAQAAKLERLYRSLS